jgi:hypothetical protein
MPQPDRPIARPVQQTQQSAWRAPQQSIYAAARPTPRLPETIARALPQQPSRQTVAREMPRPPQTFARSMPQSRTIASPVAQRSAPQVAYNPQPRAQIQMAANHAQERNAGPGAPNHALTNNSRPAQERVHRG